MPEIDLQAHYVFDTHRDVVVAGPTDEEDALTTAARLGVEDHIVVKGSSLEQRAESGIAWETGDVRQVTDGGAIDNEFEAAGASREARDTARERQARREVESQQQGGVGDQDADDGRCPDCRGDLLPCLDCWLSGGGE